jgi:hypothetical protein
MDIKQLLITDIMNSEVHSQHTTFDFEEQDGERDIHFHIDLEEWNSSLSQDEAINECFEDYDSLILQVAAERFENVELNPSVINATLIIKDKDSTYTRNDLMDFMIELNKEIQVVIEERIGVNLEIFLKEKQEEAEHELEIDNENAIRKIFTKTLEEENDSLDCKVILQSKTINDEDFDQRREKKEPTKFPGTTVKLSRDSNKRSQSISAIELSPLVRFVESSRRDYEKYIILTTSGLNYIDETKQKSTDDFYNTPAFENKDNCSFITKSSDGKGNAVDAWLTIDKKILLSQKNSESIVSQKNIDKNSPIGKYVLETIKNNPDMSDSTKKIKKMKR